LKTKRTQRGEEREREKEHRISLSGIDRDSDTDIKRDTQGCYEQFSINKFKNNFLDLPKSLKKYSARTTPSV
jgi:hypothetical protein